MFPVPSAELTEIALADCEDLEGFAENAILAILAVSILLELR